MTLLQLQYFQTIAELEHFTKAAQTLNVSQSSLSHAIKELEEELGVKLFMRQGRNVKLTKYGEMFLPYAVQALKVLTDGRACIENYINPNTGTIEISAQPSLIDFTSYITVRYISDTGRTNVNFKLDQESTQAGNSRKLLENKADFTFAGTSGDPQIEEIIVGSHELVLLVHKDHRLAGQDSADISELDGERFIAYDNTCQLRKETDAEFKRLEIAPHMAFETAQDNVIYALVDAGQGLAIVPQPLGALPFNIRVLTIKNSQLVPRKICLAWKKGNILSPASKRFLDFIRKHENVFDEYKQDLRVIDS